MKINRNINHKELEFLKDLEKLIKKPILIINKVRLQNFGVKIENDSKIGLSFKTKTSRNLLFVYHKISNFLYIFDKTK